MASLTKAQLQAQQLVKTGRKGFCRKEQKGANKSKKTAFEDVPSSGTYANNPQRNLRSSRVKTKRTIQSVVLPEKSLSPSPGSLFNMNHSSCIIATYNLHQTGLLCCLVCTSSTFLV